MIRARLLSAKPLDALIQIFYGIQLTQTTLTFSAFDLPVLRSSPRS